MGPRETAVRAGLGERPCGALYAGEDAEASRLERVTFAALFNGAGQGLIGPAGFSCGKAEAEMGWPGAWAGLQTKGLISFETGPEGPAGIPVEWSVTAAGYQARNDDLRFFRELMGAIDLDELEAAMAPPG